MKRLFALFTFLIFVSSLYPIAAQEATTQQFFVVDVVTVVVNGTAYRTPAHFGGRNNPADPILVGVFPNTMDFGLIDVEVVSAFINDSQRAYLLSLPDVLPVPVNIDNVIPQNRFTAITNALEAKGIPVITLNAGDTYHKFLREIVGEAQFFQRWTSMTGVNPYLLNPNFASLTIGALREDYQSALWLSLDMQGYDSSGLTTNNTLRQMFTGMAAQDDNRVYLIGAATL